MSWMNIDLKCDFTIKNDVKKEFMMVDEYDTQSTFAYFFQNFEKSEPHFWPPRTNFSKNVIDENRFKMWFYNKKNNAQKEFMMVDEYDNRSTFAYFLEISKELNLILTT